MRASSSGPGYRPWSWVRSDDEAAGELINARFPGLAPAVRARVLDEAEGNPLAVLELPAALSDRERAAPGALPAVLPLTRRFRNCSDLASRRSLTAQVAAVAGRARRDG